MSTGELPDAADRDLDPAEAAGLDAERIAAWLAATVNPAVSAVTLRKLPGGHSNGVWRLDAVAPGGVVPMILKAPQPPNVVHQRDACREASILAAAGALGAPVPLVFATDTGMATGLRCFAMEYVEGRALADATSAGPHDDAWLRGEGPEVVRVVWESFYDALAALHSVDAAKVPDASHGPRGALDVLDYWRAALLDVAPAASVPRQLRVLDWLRDNLPAGADDDPAVCMGDARIANCLLAGTTARALVDFEVAYLGNPAADVAYGLFFDGLHRAGAERPVDGQPSADETWARWSRVTGRPARDRGYWTAFGVTVLCVTATRAMIQWGLAGGTIETANPMVGRWEKTVERALRA
ncbi:phosphotransferase family protein [Frankia sp. AgB1.9]|uniref:phosphotransferase family protein n=1 Tax=unclassified Frankia TaxID=2632575 RepID=UPI001933D395|nr:MULTISPECIES: phosphotransferase family protein [unclassified Frankia]MBL7551622.1 phosphotransferase family protein [Frankia sp. AgB1.9]MBL7624211.1 phosphotransferase family protein [Frankia sp. AgB1.8]